MLDLVVELELGTEWVECRRPVVLDPGDWLGEDKLLDLVV